ncbi:RNA polymerase sigma factor SigA [Phycisphaerae bacterium RAS1]|nr:RNA polymerase sigma factor SigA [Phycisphaerae bacterium RAS1]
MLPGEQPEIVSPVRKIEPTSKLPANAVLRTLPDDHVEVVKRVLTETAECVFDSSFLRQDSESLYTGRLVRVEKTPRRPLKPDDSGMDLLADGELSPAAASERQLFLRLNYSRWRVMQKLEEFAGRRLTVDAIRELVRYELIVLETRDEIVRINMPLVLAMSKRTRITGVDFSDLISEGNLALLRSADKFDCNRGFKFSTYACRAILKSFSRVATRAARYRGYFPTEFDPTMEKSDHVNQKRVTVEVEYVDELKSILGRNLAQLNQVEQQVISARFALDPAADPENKAKTLEQVGEMIGVTKERVRQIQNRALSKLRSVLEESISPS